MGNTLFPNESLHKDQFLLSPSGRYKLILQDDGNLVLYDLWQASRAIWSSGTAGKAVNFAIMQSDGNFVIYGFPAAVWSTNTAGDGNAFLILQDDGNLVMYRWIEQPLWSTGTQGQ